MERLQAALEKARAQRDQSTSPQPGPRAAQQPPRTDPAVPAVAPVAPAAPDEGSWEALREFHADRALLRRNRITAFEGGVESAPFDMLRTRMVQQAKQNGWRRIALVSPHSKCGKSTTAANLAFSLSRQRNLRSIVFDLDLRRAGLTAILNQHSSLGIVAVLEREAEFAHEALRYGPNVAFGLHGGDRSATPSEILQNPQTAEVLDEIATRYAPDIMLFDMPPLMASDDNFGFLQNVDCALVVVAAEKTTMSQIDVAERHVAELTNVMGIVLNKCRYTSIGAHGHEYDYY